MTQDNMVELKPCPFCGGEAKFTRDLNAIGCTNCWAEGPVTTPEGIAGEWNTRATMHGSEDNMVERVADIIEDCGEWCGGRSDAEGLARAVISTMPGSDSGALREALSEARDQLKVFRHEQPIEALLAKIDAALNLSSETGE